jgi:NADH-ubiquinone oxidoreductase chain 6
MFITLPKINNPIIITLIIILIALTTALIFCIEVSSWYAFLLFLIYVGGILVIFAYFTATSPNQYRNKNKRIFIITPILFIGLILIILIINKSTLTIDSQSNQLIIIFTTPNIYTLIIITLVLLITIVIVVKLSSRSKGPLRAFMT